MWRFVAALVVILLIITVSFLSLRNEGQILSADSKTVILFGGDIMLGRSVTIQTVDIKKDTSYPFQKIGDVFRSSDISFANLESPFFNNCPRTTEGLIFCAPHEMAAGLTYAGFDIVNIANNHSLNYGNTGFKETEDVLAKENIKYTGANSLTTIVKNGTSFGYLGFDKSQQSNPSLTPRERSLILDSRPKVDVLIISMHWGIEYNAHPTDGQRKLATELVSLGADVVVGQHPHWVQDTDHINGKPVYYSLGNLVFDQMWSEETKQGLVMKLTFNGKQLVKEEKLPVYIKNIGQPMWSF